MTANRLLWLLVPLILLINRWEGFTAVMFFGAPAQNLCIVILIEAMTRHHRNLPGRFLNWSPVAALGVLSYSLYLWQQPFLNRHSDAWINAFPQNIAIALLCALLSYFVVERSFLAWRNRLRSYNVSPKVSGETADAR
ncbi:MAG: acyltransferase family protein [Rhodanobacteraceae bacterium]